MLEIFLFISCTEERAGFVQFILSTYNTLCEFVQNSARVKLQSLVTTAHMSDQVKKVVQEQEPAHVAQTQWFP